MRVDRRARPRRLLGWIFLVALIELAARPFVYALAPRPTVIAPRLQGALGGPSFAAVVFVSLGLAALLAATVLWLASMGVRERHLLSGAPGRAPVLSVRRFALRAAGLWVASCFVFASIESYLHYRAGLGFHGVTCLVGPVHRNAVPVLGAFANLGAALASAAGHALAWVRRTVGAVLEAPPRARHPVRVLSARSLIARPRHRQLLLLAAPRGPPAPAH